MDDFEQLDHYELLDISRSASADEIKQAYRQQMRRYHPDRVAGAPAEEQAYASRRALRINAAYQILSDFSARVTYNRNLGSRAAPAPRPHPEPLRPRDHQAELYDQARAHLDAGRTMQAAATLRELQQINPFYRDSAALLAQAEAAPGPRPAPAPRPVPSANRRSLLIGGLGGLLLAGVGAAAWWLRRPTASASPSEATAIAAAPTAAAPTAATSLGESGEPSPSPEPTLALPTPTALPPSPTAPPPSPTAAPSATPELLAEDGRLLYAEEFRGDAWPTTTGSGWSVSAGDGSYTITTDPGLGNIWAYRTSPAGEDMLIGVDVTVSGGEAGLILRFNDAGNYLAFLVSPTGRSFRLEQRAAGQVSALLDERHPAVQAGAEANNRLAARLEGDQLDLRVNGQRVASFSLAAPAPSPRYGLMAIAGNGPVNARFRDLSLRAIVP
jgi:hypothetical protein